MLVNPVNCVGVMGAGVAKEFGDAFPSLLRTYQSYCETNLMNFGTLLFYNVEFNETKKMTIINFPTKGHFKEKSRIENIELGLKTLATFAPHGLRIAMPRIGCGHGGLKWKDVEALVDSYLEEWNVLVCDGRLETFTHKPRKSSWQFFALESKKR